MSDAKQTAGRVAATDQHAELLPSTRHEQSAATRGNPVLALQKGLGNQAVQQHLLRQAIQRASVSVAPPEDEHEREAERVAELVAGGSAVPSASTPSFAPDTVWRAPEDEKKKKTDTAAKPAAAAAAPAAKPKDTAPGGPAPAAPAAAPPAAKPKEGAPAAGGTPAKPEPGKPAAGKKAEKEPTAPPKKAEEVKSENKAQEKKKQDEAPAVAMKRDAGSASAPEITPAVSAGLAGRHGVGRPLSGETRSYLEPRLGHDLGAVRVHDDAASAQAARDLGARAFTYGQDVYFAAGRYQPHTPEGRRLLAHELVHTVQQRPGAELHRSVVQRDNDPGSAAPGPAPTAGQPPTGATVDATQFTPAQGQLVVNPGQDSVIRFDKLGIPPFKAAGERGALYNQHLPLRRQKGYDRGNPDQRTKWQNEVQPTQAATTALQNLHGQSAAGGADPTAVGTNFLFKVPKGGRGNTPRYSFGSLQDVARDFVLPTWDSQGDFQRFDVDHIVELQLAGWDGSPGHWANQLPNMELLDSAANQASGREIRTTIADRIGTFKDAARGDSRIPPSVDKIKSGFHVDFLQIEGKEGGTAGDPAHWTKKQIDEGAHLAHVQAAHLSELGRPGEIKVFTSDRGGAALPFSWSGASDTTPSAAESRLLRPFTIRSKTFPGAGPGGAGDQFGNLTVEVPAGDKKWQPLPAEPVPVTRMMGLPFAGSIDRGSLFAKLRRFRKTGASPIEVTETDILPGVGVVVAGRIMPEIPALQGVGIDFELSGDDLRVYKEFSAGEVRVPRPFVINDITVVASAGTESGLQLAGQIDFGIERVGQGLLRATTSVERGIEFEGQFDFDSKLFDPARITVAYREGAWSGAGDLGIPPGKVPGLRRGQFHAAYSEGRLDASGTAETTIPGVTQAALALSYSEDAGLAIGGQLTLSSDIPGIRGGQIDARVEQRPGGDDYRVTAHGTAQPAIPGVDATLTVAYDDGAITLEGDAAYSRDPVSGHVHVGATNRPVDPQGNPVPGGAPTEHFTAYGGGSVTIRLTSWLQGTAGIRILPNGEIELSGAISLPATVDVFPEKSYERNILTIGLDIPIVGVAFAGQRIGIFATIQGGLDFSAGVGPGQLRQLGLEVTFNPAHPDQTHVVGGAQLHIPAHAGLRLFVRGGVGAGIPLVSATVGLEVGGALGLAAAVDAGVHVDWTPSQGIVLDAAGDVSVEPKFRFDITGFAQVEAGVGPLHVDLYSKRWQLAAVEYGSGLRLGMHFPIHYEEGKPFDVSWSDVQWQIPDVNPRELVSGLIRQIA